MRKRMTRKLEFPPEVRRRIKERDRDCFFCRRYYHMEYALAGDLVTKDIMHIVPRSHLGLGVEQNGVLGCRYHHTLLDNGNKGLHREMEDMLKEYMREQYPGWTPESVTYHKYG